MELEAVGLVAMAEGLVLEGLAGGELDRIFRQGEALAVPVVDLPRPGTVGKPLLGGRERIVADLDQAVGALMGAAGLTLWFPVAASRILPAAAASWLPGNRRPAARPARAPARSRVRA